MNSSKLKRILKRNRSSLRAVKGSLFSAAGGDPVKIVAVTSCRPGDGRTTAAVCLAWALAEEGGRKVVLVDGSGQSSSLAEIFGLSRTPGWTDLLLEKASLEEVVRPTELPHLWIVPCGSSPDDSLDAFEPDRFGRALFRLGEGIDHLIYDGEPVLTSSQACMLAPLFGGVVFAVECGKTRWQVLDLARDMVERAGGSILGVILNKRKYHVPRFLYGKV